MKQQPAWQLMCRGVCVCVGTSGTPRSTVGGWFCQVLMALNERHWILWVFNGSPESSQHWVTGAALMRLKLTGLGIKDADHVKSLPWSLPRLLCTTSPELIHPFSATMTSISQSPTPLGSSFWLMLTQHCLLGVLLSYRTSQSSVLLFVKWRQSHFLHRCLKE